MPPDRTPNNGCFYYNTPDNYVQCQNSQQRNIVIHADDIVCIIPKRELTGYTVLFLRREHQGPGSDLQDECECLESASASYLSPKLLSQHIYETVPRHLRTNDRGRREIHVIISTFSGTGRAKRICHRILRPLLWHLGLSDHEIHETESAHTVIELCRSKFILNAESGVSQTIILLSGDGGLTDIVDTFHTMLKTTLCPPTLALVPTGTGNAMASSIGISSRPLSALVTLLRGTPKPLPVFSATFSPGARYVTDEGHSRALITNGLGNGNTGPRIYGAVVFSWGMHAALVADSDTAEYRRFGANRFKMAANELLFPSSGTETHRYTGTVTLMKSNGQSGSGSDKTMATQEHMYLLATLVSRLEENFMISPESSPLDGCLRIVHFGPLPPEHAMQLMGDAYRGGEHVKDNHVYYSEIAGLRIDFDEREERWRRVCIDGKVVVVEDKGWVEVNNDNKCVLNILVPPQQLE